MVRIVCFVSIWVVMRCKWLDAGLFLEGSKLVRVMHNYWLFSRNANDRTCMLLTRVELVVE